MIALIAQQDIASTPYKAEEISEETYSTLISAELNRGKRSGQAAALSNSKQQSLFLQGEAVVSVMDISFLLSHKDE